VNTTQRPSAVTLTPDPHPGPGVGAVAEPTLTDAQHLLADLLGATPLQPVPVPTPSVPGTGGVLTVEVSHPTPWMTIRRITHHSPSSGACQEPVSVLGHLVACGRRFASEQRCGACRQEIHTTSTGDTTARSPIESGARRC
jgi:hypothetical protein